MERRCHSGGVRAVSYPVFGERPRLIDLPTPILNDSAAIIEVEATGLCRSDIHGWLGHDPDIALPHVPGHELVGRVAAVGHAVNSVGVGTRVTVPFVCACGRCPECLSDRAQVCRNQTQPGFTHHGSFAELVLINHADLNAIVIDDDLDTGAAALLGCRFATAFRGLRARADVQAGETVLIVGCGGVGLSAVMIATAMNADVVAVDIDPTALDRALAAGATSVINSAELTDAEFDAVLAQLRPDGIQVSMDALGRADTLDVCLRSLSAGGRHLQIGLLPENPVTRMAEVIGRELSVLGCHGMSARHYPELIDWVATGRLRPQDLIERWITLDQVPDAMIAMASDHPPAGVTMIKL